MTAESQELFEKVKAILDKHYEKDKDAYFPYLDESALEISEILYADKIAFAKHHCSEQVKAILDSYYGGDRDALDIKEGAKLYILNIK